MFLSAMTKLQISTQGNYYFEENKTRKIIAQQRKPKKKFSALCMLWNEMLMRLFGCIGN